PEVPERGRGAGDAWAAVLAGAPGPARVPVRWEPESSRAGGGFTDGAPWQPAAEDSAEEDPWLIEVNLTSRPLRRPRAASRVREAAVLLGSTTPRGRTMAPYEVVVAPILRW